MGAQIWDEALDWLLFPLMASYLVHCEPFALKPLCQPLVLAGMPPLFSALLMKLYPIIPWEMFYSKWFCCEQWLPDPNIVIFLDHDNNWHHIAFWLSRAMVDRNSLHKSFIAAVSTRQGVPLGILVLLPSLSGMVKAELPGTHIGWLVLPIQTLSNSPSSLIQK